MSDSFCSAEKEREKERGPGWGVCARLECNIALQSAPAQPFPGLSHRERQSGKEAGGKVSPRGESKPQGARSRPGRPLRVEGKQLSGLSGAALVVFIDDSCFLLGTECSASSPVTCVCYPHFIDKNAEARLLI